MKTEELKKRFESQNALLQKTKRELAKRLRVEEQSKFLVYGQLAFELAQKNGQFKQMLADYVPESKLSAKQRKLLGLEKPVLPENQENFNNEVSE